MAWAVVNVENKDNSTWFLELLEEDLGCSRGNRLTLMSDQHKGLIEDVKDVIPNAEHRQCARHIYENFKKQYPPRAFFEVDRGCKAIKNGFSKCFNSVIVNVRHKPLLTMLEAIRVIVLERMNKIREISRKWNPGFWHVIPAGENLFEVRSGSEGFTVDEDKRTCSCRMWQLSGLPCVHATKVIFLINRVPESYVPAWFETDMYFVAYHNYVKPVLGMNFWPDQSMYSIVLPPKPRKMFGRPRKKRIRAIGEGGSSTRVSKVGSQGSCSNCKKPGHNKSSCKELVVEQTPKPKGVVGRPRKKQPVDDFEDVDVVQRGPMRDEGASGTRGGAIGSRGRVGRGGDAGSRGGASGSIGRGAGGFGGASGLIGRGAGGSGGASGQEVEGKKETPPKANLQKLAANVLNDADYDVWLPLASVHEGVDSMLRNGPWMFCGILIFLNKFSPSVSLPNKGLSRVPVWVKFHEVPLVAHTSDGLSFIATKIGTPIMLDSYTNSIYNLVMVVPNLEGTGYMKETVRVEYEWEPPHYITEKKSGGNNRGNKNFKLVSVKPETHYRPKANQSTEAVTQKMTLVGKKNVSTSCNGTFSLSNSFEALNVENLVIEDIETGNKASTFEVQEEGQSSTPLVEKINIFEKQLPRGEMCALININTCNGTGTRGTSISTYRIRGAGPAPKPVVNRMDKGKGGSSGADDEGFIEVSKDEDESVENEMASYLASKPLPLGLDMFKKKLLELWKETSGMLTLRPITMMICMKATKISGGNIQS
ncbi:multidrug resistance-associated protein 5 [Tanacetum coccineum]